MANFQIGAGAVVAADSKNTVSAIDDAMLNHARMLASFIEVTQGANLSADKSQKFYKSMSAGLNAFVEGRGDIVSAIRQLNYIKSISNLREENFGCPIWVEAAPGPVAAAPAREEASEIEA